jgi:uncharacterized protein (TIGR02466 family)
LEVAVNEDKASPIAGSEILSVFPTFIWKLHVRRSVSDRINGAVLDKLASVLGTLRPGQAWQSEQNWHELPALVDLVACIERSAAPVLRFLHVAHEGFKITGCWVNVNATGAAHRVHTHPNNYLSCVYYVQTAPGADTINFHDPRIQTSIIRPPVTRLTGENADQAVVPVQDGTLLMFPAWLAHSVDANASDKPRISASCNIMFEHYAEIMSRPLWTSSE